MSTKKTAKSDNTSTNNKSISKQKANDNKTIFGPLGKYAIAAVIMVGIIVTTALMLNKQHGTVEEQLAAMESEVARLHSVTPADTVVDHNQASTTIEPAAAVKAEANKIEVAKIKSMPVEVAPVVQQKNVTEIANQTTPAITIADKQETVTEVVADKQEVAPYVATSTRPAKTVTPEQVRHTPLAMENQARIEAHKLEQKQHMTEMFARIKTLEAKQLDQYKAGQDQHVVRLREQIAHQQQLIEALILRNSKSLKMREASFQRHQDNREQMLNRI